MNSKEVIYFLGHGHITGQTTPLHPFMTVFDPGADFGGMTFQDGNKFVLTALHVDVRKWINPELVMMAGCITGMTDEDSAVALTDENFSPGSAAFAEAFHGGAYVGWAWDADPTRVHTAMTKYVTELKKTLTFRESYDQYRLRNKAKGDAFLKLYKWKDPAWVGNDVKAGSSNSGTSN